MHLIDYYRKMIDVKKNIVNILQQGALNWLLQENDRCKKNILLIFCSRVHLIDYYRKMIDVKKNILLTFCSSGALIWLLEENDRCKKNIVNILQQCALNWLLQENDRCKKNIIFC